MSLIKIVLSWGFTLTKMNIRIIREAFNDLDFYTIIVKAREEFTIIICFFNHH